MLKILLLTMSLLGVSAISSKTFAGVADDIYPPRIEDLRFTQSSVIVDTANGSFVFQRNKFGMTEKKSAFRTAETNRLETVKKLESPEGTKWILDGGIEYHSMHGYCAEGQNIKHSLKLLGKKLKTYLPGCDSISALGMFHNQLWLGAIRQWELSNGPGSGIRAIDKKNSRLIFSLKPQRDLIDGFVKILRADDFSDSVWVVTESGIHKVKNAKVIEKWYLSEQFNKHGQAVLYASHKPKKSNPWALLFREAGIEDTRSVWAEVNSYHGVRDRLNYMYDEEGYHFRIDGLKMGDKIELQPMAASWPIEYGFLVDYFLNAIRTNQITNNVWSTEAFVCAFKDKRIMNFVRELQRNEINNAFEAGVRKFNTKFCVGIQSAIGMN